MVFTPYGDKAILINFEQEISLEINAKVIALNYLIEAASLNAIQYCIPAYCSLTVCYNPLLTSYNELCESIKSLSTNSVTEEHKTTQRTLHIPICYDEPYSLDFKDLTEQTKLEKKEIIALHTKTKFRVYMLGFMPGFAYMGKLPEPLFCNRKTNPRLDIPAGSLGLAGLQTGIYPIKSPGGWQIIGRTPIPVINIQKNQSFLFNTGDNVCFEAISSSSFLNIQKDISSNQFNWGNIYD
ncbi:5-oxoprolinase subunit PxpB [Aureispira]|nr:5-oxoprolinase subunit PxpB [Aureispira sp.]